MTPSNDPSRNRILAALPLCVYERLQPDLELVHISIGDEIYDPDLPIIYLYFPLDCIIACVAELSDGEALLTAITGQEGMVDIFYLFGGEKAPARAVALSGGSAPGCHGKEMRSQTPLKVDSSWRCALSYSVAK
ncbi:MAG: hypothetical protein ABI167_06985 [Nitrosospira sp.]